MILFLLHQFIEIYSLLFSLENRFHGACAHHDLGKIYRNAWEYNEIVNPNDAIKHLIAAKDEFTDLNQARNAACVEMDLAHIYINIQKIEQAVELLFSARKNGKTSMTFTEELNLL